MTTKIDINHWLHKPYARKLTPDESGGYVATIQEFPGCMGYGDNAAEAMEKLEAAAETWIEAALATNYPIPEPANYDSASGKIALRISRRLHQIAAERADLEATSVNQLIAVALAAYLGQQQGLDKSIALVKEQLALTRSHSNVGSNSFSSASVSHPHSRTSDSAARPTTSYVTMANTKLQEPQWTH